MLRKRKIFPPLILFKAMPEVERRRAKRKIQGGMGVPPVLTPIHASIAGSSIVLNPPQRASAPAPRATALARRANALAQVSQKPWEKCANLANSALVVL